MSKSVGVAKKYAKALLEGASEAELKSLGEVSAKASALFSIPKFREIVKSPLEESTQKVALVLEGSESKDAKFTNLVNLLAAAKRLPLLPAIAEEIREEIARRENRYEGTVVSQTPVSGEEVKDLEAKLSSHLGTTVVLTAVAGEYDGFKVEVPDLGVKIDFSQEKLNAQLLAHVLRGI